jgi:hypothetical protein
VRINHGQWRVFLGEVLKKRNLGDVLEHIGVIARMEAVSV